MERDVTSNMYPAALTTTGSELCKVGVVAANTALQCGPGSFQNDAITQAQNWELDKLSIFFLFSGYMIVYLKDKSAML